jgi:hypothetical protein
LGTADFATPLDVTLDAADFFAVTLVVPVFFAVTVVDAALAVLDDVAVLATRRVAGLATPVFAAALFTAVLVPVLLAVPGTDAFAAGLVALVLGAGAFFGAALSGAASFGGTPLLPELTFFTAMLGPFKMALHRPHGTRTGVGEDKAIRQSSQWRNAALDSINPDKSPEPVTASRSEQERGPHLTVGAPLLWLASQWLRADDQPLPDQSALRPSATLSPSAFHYQLEAVSLEPICSSSCS